MKKIISAATAIVLALTVVLSLAGCNKKPENTETTTEKVADVRIGYVDCEPDDELLVRWLSDQYRYESIIADDFGLGADGAKKFYESAYFVYGVSVEIVNNTDESIEITGVKSDTNGDSGVYIRRDFSGGEIGVAPHSSTPATLQVICTNEDASDGQVVEAVKAMAFNVSYAQGTKENTAVIMLEDSVTVNGAEKKDNEVIRLGGDGVLFSNELWDKYKTDTEANRAALKTGFGVSDEFLNEFYKKSEDYNFFNYPIRIQNMTEKDIVILDITVDSSSADGIYVNVLSGSEMGIPAYDPYADYPLPTFAVQVLSDNLDLEDAQVQSIIDTMNFTLTYAAKTADGEADYETKQTVTVTVG